MYSLLLSLGGTAGGWAITSNLAGDQAGNAFLVIAGAVIGLIHPSQFFLLTITRTRVFWQLLYRLACGVSLCWFLLCLALPICWMPQVPSWCKILLAAVGVLLSAANFVYALGEFERKWAAKGQRSFEKHYRSNTHTVDWDHVMKPVNLRAQLHIPGLPDQISMGILVFAALTMVIGLNVRKAYPVFSVFAWGLPAVLCVVVWVQIVGYGVGQLMKVRELERRLGKTISFTTP